ncbi:MULTISPECIES: hypothetical protein [Streptomyces]|uniref:hypothetical protein n=1 Tax=Streptomyces TaxID=1883 RepID=UPI0031EDD5A8
MARVSDGARAVRTPRQRLYKPSVPGSAGPSLGHLKIQYRPHLIDGCLPPTGLIMDYGAIGAPDSTSSP